MSKKIAPLLSERLWEIIKSLDGNVADWVIDDLGDIHEELDNAERLGHNDAKLGELLKFIHTAIKVMERTANDTLDGRNAAIDGRELLAKYPEQP